MSARKMLLLGKLTSGVTAESKKRGWEMVAAAVSTVGGTIRDSESVKKKWADYKSTAKKKGAERFRELKKTGGGVANNVQIDQLEEKVLAVIGDTLIEGVEGGTDTAEDADDTIAGKLASYLARFFLHFLATV